MQQKKTNNPLNGKGTAMIAAAPLIFGVAEVGFHAHPLVGLALGALGGVLAYRHYDDVVESIDKVAGEAVRGYSPRTASPTRISPEAIEREVALVKTLEGTSDFASYPLPLGKVRDGKTFTRTPKQLKSIIILGLQEGGKSNSAIHIIRHLVPVGARLAIIDKHAHSEEDSLTQKITCLGPAFDCANGHDPNSSIAVVQHVRAILDNRMEGAKCSYPLVLVCDEFSAIMRQKEDGGKWKACAEVLAGLIEDINTEGRKHKVFCICIGQISNVSRTGGSEIRELFATRIAHAMSVKQAQLFGFTDEAKQIQAMEKGHICIQTEGLQSAFIKVPYVKAEELQSTARRIPAPRKQTDHITEDFDRSAIPETKQTIPATPPIVIEPIIQERSRKADEIDKNAAVALWNAGYNSRRKLAAVLGITENQASKLMEIIGVKSEV